jgi:hypothetical protein
MTPTNIAPIVSTPMGQEWLERLIAAFHSGHRALPLRSNRLLEQLHAEAEVVAGTARVLYRGMESGCCATVLPDLETCLSAVRRMDQELTISLCRTLVTPIDGEDLKLLSGHSVRLVRQQTRMARMLATEGDGGLLEMQKPVVEWAESFARAVSGLPGKSAKSEAENMQAAVRRVLYLLRDERCRLLGGNAEVRGVMRDLARIDVFEETMEQMKAVDGDVLRILLKWQ